MKIFGVNDKNLAAEVLAANHIGDEVGMREAALELAGRIYTRLQPRTVIRSMANIDGVPGRLKHIRLENDTGVVAQVECRSSSTKAGKITRSISCPPLGPGSSPKQAEELAYSLLLVACLAESIARDMSTIAPESAEETSTHK